MSFEDGVVHAALFYASENEFLEFAVPFVTGGVEAGHAVLAVANAENLRALRSTVGSAPLRYIDASHWYARPTAAVGGYLSFVRNELDRGKPAVRIIGEVAFPAGDPLVQLEWRRYESILTPVFETLPTWVVCPYNTRRLPPEIVDGARTTHSEVAEDGRVSASASYEPAERVIADMAPDLPLAAGSVARDFHPAALSDAGSFIEGQARRAGLDEPRVQRLVSAAVEVIADCFVGEESPIVVSAWSDREDFQCQIEGEDALILDPLIGFHPSPDGSTGRGLWLARQRCDLVEVGAGVQGTAVRLHMRRPTVR